MRSSLQHVSQQHTLQLLYWHAFHFFIIIKVVGLLHFYNQSRDSALGINLTSEQKQNLDSLFIYLVIFILKIL